MKMELYLHRVGLRPEPEVFIYITLQHDVRMQMGNALILHMKWFARAPLKVFAELDKQMISITLRCKD